MKKFDIARPYTDVYIILKKDNLVAAVKRTNTNWMDGFYGLPAGKVENNETYAEAAVREAHEEVGVVIQASQLRAVHVQHRKTDDTLWVGVFFVAELWQGEPHNAEPERSDEFKWLDLNNLPENVVPSQRAALDFIDKRVFYSEYGWTTN